MAKLTALQLATLAGFCLVTRLRNHPHERLALGECLTFKLIAGPDLPRYGEASFSPVTHVRPRHFCAFRPL